MVAVRRFMVTASVVAALAQSGCGTYVPRIEEPWEEVELPENLEYRIKDYLFCQTVEALKHARKNVTVDGKPAIPDNFGVQMQVVLTVEENTGINPGLTFNRVFHNASQSGVNVGQTFNLGLGANLSSTATRTDTMYSYYNIGRISGPGKNTYCDTPRLEHGSSLLLQSNLGIEQFLDGAALQEKVFSSSKAPTKNKDAKLDVYSYDIKFAIVTNGNINPSWKLVNVSADTGSTPLFAQGRTRTHELVLTFGPGVAAPSPESLQTHFTSQIVEQLNRLGTPQ